MGGMFRCRIAYIAQFNTLRPRQHGRQFAHSIFTSVVLYGCCILIQMSPKFTLNGQIKDTAAFVQIMACPVFGTKPLSEPMMA